MAHTPTTDDNDVTITMRLNEWLQMDAEVKRLRREAEKAAPDLLAAARTALQVARDPWNYTEAEQIAILDAVEAVIAKAEGGE